MGQPVVPGALVAYSSEVKHEVLDVPAGTVVSATAACAMARGARRLLGSDVAVAVTGVGGPEPEDGRVPGTVFLAVDGPGDHHRVLRLKLAGDPGEVCAAAAEAALEMLARGWSTADRQRWTTRSHAVRCVTSIRRPSTISPAAASIVAAAASQAVGKEVWVAIKPNPTGRRTHPRTRRPARSTWPPPAPTG